MSTFVGFGFGAIQGGLFLPEAYISKNFDRLVVSEIDEEAVGHLMQANGSYSFNIAESSGLRKETICGIEILNPLIPEDRKELVSAIAESQEICTALPSFKLYDYGNASVAKLIGEGIKRKLESPDMPNAVIYAAENDASAADKLRQACHQYAPVIPDEKIVFSETVIAKMCSVVTDRNRISTEGLVTLVDGLDKAILVEAFDQIFIEHKSPKQFNRGLSKFHTKSDLEPYAITKFLGHNAIHALLGYFARNEGILYMHELSKRMDLIETVKSSFINEVGVGLIHEYGHLDDSLFTDRGFHDYVEDALTRMINPFLRDPIARVTRDPVRKLGWDDRLIGSMKLAIAAGVEPRILARGVAIAFEFACKENSWPTPEFAMGEIWNSVPRDKQTEVRELILSSL